MKMSENEYDTTLEFPGNDVEGENSEASNAPQPKRDCLHLVVLSSPVIPSKKRIAVISNFQTVSIGRDAVPPGSGARLRFKEMAVSKYHATLFWDGSLFVGKWGLVDVGSVHGTFVRTGKSQERRPGDRLSPPRISSHPKYLNHLDEITIGNTLLQCHIHSGPTDCDSCQPTLSNEISLNASPIRSGESASPATPVSDSSPRATLGDLKRRLLTKHQGASNSISTYVDRAAARRELHGVSVAPLTNASSLFTSSNAPSSAMRSRMRSYARYDPEVQSSQQETSIEETSLQPIAATNIGHKLLVKQGWTPGVGLGEEGRRGSVDPVSERIKVSTDRGGLGSSLR